jgi:hypothetical protein
MMFRRHRIAIALIVVLAGSVLAGAAIWRSVIPGLSSARSEPPAIEVSVATLLLQASVPSEDKARTNPLGGDPADIAAGQDIFRQKCGQRRQEYLSTINEHRQWLGQQIDYEKFTSIFKSSLDLSRLSPFSIKETLPHVDFDKIKSGVTAIIKGKQHGKKLG